MGKLYLLSSFFPTKPDQSTQKTDQSCDLLKVKFVYANLVGPNLVMECDGRMFYCDGLLMAIMFWIGSQICEEQSERSP